MNRNNETRTIWLTLLKENSNYFSILWKHLVYVSDSSCNLESFKLQMKHRLRVRRFSICSVWRKSLWSLLALEKNGPSNVLMSTPKTCAMKLHVCQNNLLYSEVSHSKSSSFKSQNSSITETNGRKNALITEYWEQNYKSSLIDLLLDIFPTFF